MTPTPINNQSRFNRISHNLSENTKALVAGAAGVTIGKSISLFTNTSLSYKGLGGLGVIGSRVVGAISGKIVPKQYAGYVGALTGGALGSWCAAETMDQIVNGGGDFNSNPYLYCFCCVALCYMPVNGVYQGYTYANM